MIENEISPRNDDPAEISVALLEIADPFGRCVVLIGLTDTPLFSELFGPGAAAVARDGLDDIIRESSSLPVLHSRFVCLNHCLHLWLLQTWIA